MKKNILLLVLTIGSLTSCMVSAETIVPSKNYITKKVKVGNFEGVSTATSIDVAYTQTSGSQDIEIYAPDNLMEFVKVEVEGGILKVGFHSDKDKGMSISGSHRTEVRVSAPAVHAFHASSSGDIILKNGLQTTGKVSLKSSSSGDIEGGKVKCDELLVSASSSGDVDLEKVECTLLEVSASSSGDVEIEGLKAEKVSADASSAGDVILSGVCRSAKFSASSSGDVEAQNLKADNVAASASSAGDVTCYAVESLSASTSSAGSVNYKGNPQIESRPKRGLNKID